MSIDKSIFKSYDIRGIYPDQINEKNIYQIAQAIYKLFQEKKGDRRLSVVVGRDMRLSAPKLYPIFKKGFVDAGAKLVDVGLVSTPTFYFAVLNLKTDAGAQLTASHNPPKYNGVKFVVRQGEALMKIGGSTGMKQVKKYALDEVSVKSSGGSEEKYNNIVEKEIRHAFKLISPKGIKPLKVIADPANAMAGTYIEALFKQLPCELVKMNFELDGSFPAHQPDPLVFSNLIDLQKKVLEEKADFGLAPDGDGDRLFFIDEKGQIIAASAITALVARELLKKFPGETILYDIRYILTPKKIIQEFGGKSDITRVGHAFITKRMHETGAIFGGESSGHYFFRHTGGAESQIPTIMLVLKALSEESKPLSEIVKELVRSFESGEINFETSIADKIIKALKDKYHDGKLSELDGVAIEYPIWRFGVRTSNTEPLMRLNIEANSKALVKEKRKEISNFILSKGAKLH